MQQVHRDQADRATVVLIEQFRLGRTSPRSGLDFDGRASRMVVRSRSESPGRSGLAQRSSSTPGEAKLATWTGNGRRAAASAARREDFVETLVSRDEPDHGFYADA